MLAALAVVALLSTEATPTDWWYVIMSGEPGQLNAHYADRASIRRDGDRVRVTEAREGEVAADNGILSSRTLVEYDCRAGAGRIIHGDFFGGDGTVLSHEEGDGVFLPAEPESVAESLLRFACGEEEGNEQLGELGLREHTELLFRDYHAYLAAEAGRPE